MHRMKSLHLSTERTLVFPFYIFITLLLGYLGMTAVRSMWSAERGNALLLAFLLFLHIGMYWLNVLWVNRTTKWWYFYYPAQTIMMMGMVFLLDRGSPGGLSLYFSTTICMVGEALGVWGNSRRAFYLSAFYIGLLIVFLYLFSVRTAFFDALTNLLVNGGSIILFMVIFNQLFIQRQKAIELAESLESANAKLAASAAKIELLTLQNERQRMARELHDTLAQGVAGLVLQLEAVKAHLASNRTERASAIVEQSITRARSTLTESRAAIDDLRAVSVSVADSVHGAVERFRESTGIPCELEIAVQENQVAPETINHAMNILSESLTNVARHAQATQAWVKFLLQKEILEIAVRDNGK